MIKAEAPQPNNRASSNLAMLEFVARKLEKLREKLIFLGGCATALLIDDPAAPDIRTTLDVDCIVDVLSLGHYHQLEEQLFKLGFKQSMGDSVICRWRYQEIILDVMPANEKILGFGNRWYSEAIVHAMRHDLFTDLSLKSVTAPYFLATKFEAFKNRGQGDYLMSHDLEDIVAVIDGRLNLLTEVSVTQAELKKYLADIFLQLLGDVKFTGCLAGHLNYGTATIARANIVLNRMRQIVELAKE